MAGSCAELGPDARVAGAVNTVRIEEGGGLVGEMFDGLGLLAGMRAGGIEVADKRVLPVGAGGAGRAIRLQAAGGGRRRAHRRDPDRGARRRTGSGRKCRLPQLPGGRWAG